MTLCVIGKNSFIAKNLSADIKLDRNECNLLDYQQTYEVLASVRPSAIINCAARHGSSLDMSTDHVKFLEENVLMNLNLLRAAHKLNIENVLLLGSISSFPFNNGENFGESNYYGGPVNERNLGYNLSKRFLVDLAKAYQFDYSRNYKVAYLGNIYGPNSTFDLNSTLVGNLIFQISQSKKKNQNLELYGDGSDVRSLTFVRDLNSILVKLVEMKTQTEPVIISSQELISIKELSELIAGLLGYKKSIRFVGPRNSGNRKVAISEVFPKLFPDFRFTPIKQGLRETVEWWQLQQKGRPSSVGRASLS